MIEEATSVKPKKRTIAVKSGKPKPVTNKIKIEVAELDLKLAEIEFKKSEIKYKEVETDEKLKYIEKWKELELNNNNDWHTIIKTNILIDMLGQWNVDESYNQMGSEPKLKPVFDSDEIIVIKNKLFELIEKF